jgi:uncharacterized membrane protein YgcG
VAAFVVWVVALPLLPTETSSASTAAPPVSGAADVPAAGNDPGPVGGRLAAPPAALAPLNPSPTHSNNGAPVTLAAVSRGGGLPMAAGQPGPAVQPSRPAEPADLGQRVDPPALDQVRRRAAGPSEPAHAEQLPRQRPPAPPSHLPVFPDPAPTPQFDKLGPLAKQLAQLKLDRSGDAGPGKPAPPQQGRPSGPNIKGRSPAGNASVSPQLHQARSGGGGLQRGNGQSGSNSGSSRSGGSSGNGQSGGQSGSSSSSRSK